MTNRVDWNGLLVTEEDYYELCRDYIFFGNAFVASDGNGLGHRIDPKDIYLEPKND